MFGWISLIVEAFAEEGAMTSIVSKMGFKDMNMFKKLLNNDPVSAIKRLAQLPAREIKALENEIKGTVDIKKLSKQLDLDPQLTKKIMGWNKTNVKSKNGKLEVNNTAKPEDDNEEVGQYYPLNSSWIKGATVIAKTATHVTISVNLRGEDYSYVVSKMTWKRMVEAPNHAGTILLKNRR